MNHSWIIVWEFPNSTNRCIHFREVDRNYGLPFIKLRIRRTV